MAMGFSKIRPWLDDSGIISALDFVDRCHKTSRTQYSAYMMVRKQRFRLPTQVSLSFPAARQLIITRSHFPFSVSVVLHVVAQRMRRLFY